MNSIKPTQQQISLSEGTIVRQLPWYRIVAGQLYPTIHHPDGYSARPWFAIKGNKVYRSLFHPEGYSSLPQYYVVNNKLYPRFNTKAAINTTLILKSFDQHQITDLISRHVL